MGTLGSFGQQGAELMDTNLSRGKASTLVRQDLNLQRSLQGLDPSFAGATVLGRGKSSTGGSW